MSRGLVATAEITVNASPSAVWAVLTTPEKVKQLMFGADVITDWKEGSSIIYKGIWEGKPFEDKGKIITFLPEKLLVTTHWSALSGVPDIPENYHTLRYEITKIDKQTHITLTQDNNASEEEQKHAAWIWRNMLGTLKKMVENTE